MQPMTSKSQNIATGALGEAVAAQRYRNHGFEILDLNYYRKIGEIDIIALKNDSVHFIEVKTVAHETKYDLEKSVSYGTLRPEEKVHRHKLHKLRQIIEIWLHEKQYSGAWQLDVVAVRLVKEEKYARVIVIENVIID